MSPQEHNKLIGVFLMVNGAFQSFVMIIVGLIYAVIGAAFLLGGRAGEDQAMGAAFIALIFGLMLFAAVVFLPQVLAGWKMFKEKPNARTWGIIGSVLACISFPLGTAAAVYGFWFLFGDVGKQFYLAGGTPTQYPALPPDPGSWRQ